MIDRRFDPGTPIRILLKDLGLIGELASEQTMRLLMGSLAREVFEEAKALDLADRDIAALVLPLEKLTGISVEG